MTEEVEIKENKKNYKTIDLKYKPQLHGGPFSIAFCYTREGPLVIKGSLTQISTYLSTIPICHYQLTTWRSGWCKSKKWMINHKDWNINIRRKGKRRYYLISYQNEIVLNIRTMPNRFIKIFDSWSKAHIILSCLEEKEKKETQ